MYHGTDYIQFNSIQWKSIQFNSGLTEGDFILLEWPTTILISNLVRYPTKNKSIPLLLKGLELGASQATALIYCPGLGQWLACFPLVGQVPGLRPGMSMRQGLFWAAKLVSQLNPQHTKQALS